ncbi:MAG: hypothetical protein QX199_17820 [Methylococcaceae bacterium]
MELSALFDDGKTVFNFNGNAQYSGCVQQHNQNGYGIGACSAEYLHLNAEFEKLRAVNDQQMQEIVYLRGLADACLKKDNC